jgi:hypothetical protein
MSLEDFLHKVDYDIFVEESKSEESEEGSRPTKILKLDTPLLDSETVDEQDEVVANGINVNNYEDLEGSMNRPLEFSKTDVTAMKELLFNYSDSDDDESVNKAS